MNKSFLAGMGSREGNAIRRGQINDKNARPLVDVAINHARIDLPVDMLSILGLRSNEEDRHGGICQILVPDFSPDSLVRKSVVNLTSVDRGIDENPVRIIQIEQALFVGLIVSVVVTNENLPFWGGCSGLRLHGRGGLAQRRLFRSLTRVFAVIIS